MVFAACTTPHVEQTKKTDQTCHTYSYLRQVLVISKEIHPPQKIRCKLNPEADALCTALYPITPTFIEIGCLKDFPHYVRHMFSQDHGELSDSVNEWGEEAQQWNWKDASQRQEAGSKAGQNIAAWLVSQAAIHGG